MQLKLKLVPQNYSIARWLGMRIPMQVQHRCYNNNNVVNGCSNKNKNIEINDWGDGQMH